MGAGTPEKIGDEVSHVFSQEAYSFKTPITTFLNLLKIYYYYFLKWTLSSSKR